MYNCVLDNANVFMYNIWGDKKKQYLGKKHNAKCCLGTTFKWCKTCCTCAQVHIYSTFGTLINFFVCTYCSQSEKYMHKCKSIIFFASLEGYALTNCALHLRVLCKFYDLLSHLFAQPCKVWVQESCTLKVRCSYLHWGIMQATVGSCSFVPILKPEKLNHCIVGLCLNCLIVNWNSWGDLKNEEVPNQIYFS